MKRIREREQNRGAPVFFLCRTQDGLDERNEPGYVAGAGTKEGEE
jgi:hypothetical protein